MSTTHEEMKIELDAAEDPKKDVTQESKKNDDLSIPAEDSIPDQTAEGLEKLKKQLETERAGRIAAERRAQEASVGEARARGEVQTSQIDLLTNAIETVKGANDALKREYSAALASGEFERVADIQMEMSTNAAKLLALENGKASLEKQPKPQPRPMLDEVEEFARRCTPESAAWVRSHPEYVTDKQKNRVMIAAHELALAQGHKADTDNYFEAVEKTLNLRKSPTNGNGNGLHHEDPDPMADAARPSTNGRKAAPAAAPVSRSGTANGGRPDRVTLTAAEVEAAELSGLTPEEYAKNKIALKKDGRLN